MGGQVAGFIGCGAMGSALARAWAAAGGSGTLCCDVDGARAGELAAAVGGTACAGAAEVLERASIVVLAVKPQQLADAAHGLAETSRAKTLVSVLAGVTLARLAQYFPHARLVRVMPNLPALIGAGVHAWAAGPDVGAAETAAFAAVFGASGRLFQVDEKMLDAVTGLSGSGPAYAFLLMNALAEGGVREGLPKALALPMAAATFLGAARMVLESGTHPEELKDHVVSPAGTTAAGLAVLEERAVRGALIDAVSAAAARARELGKG